MSLKKSSFLESCVQNWQSRAEWAGARYVRERTSMRSIRNGQPDRNTTFLDEGIMIEVLHHGHFGYAATADLSENGLHRAFERAHAMAVSASPHRVHAMTSALRPQAVGSFNSRRSKHLDQLSLQEITSTLHAASDAMKTSDLAVSRVASAMIVETDIVFVSTNGSRTEQNFDIVTLDLGTTAAQGSETQTRTLNGWNARGFQVGAEVFDRTLFIEAGRRVSMEAVELLSSPNCPEGTMDLILMPDQMMLQIHESIGHPLEIDRILGDERNYAGWSFVKQEDFGNLQYGSKLMNVSFDPHSAGEMASYAFDDGGNPATKEHLIKDGLLLRGLGSLESQTRSGLKGVANFRSASWNRAPIDRMANINLDPGTSSLEEMISSVGKGVIMNANRSWSIDDYRNKFQFGCEQAFTIENGKIKNVVKNPNYRGTTVKFWNQLAAVGNHGTVETYGTPYCGKGEPSQVIRVGHASPPCLFRDVEVFGGQS